MIRIFGDQSLSEYAIQLVALDENFKLKKFTTIEYESKKVWRFVLFFFE